jgi:superoxide dismutase, Cu-Zn family
MVRHLRSICGSTLILCCAIVSGACVTEEPDGNAVASSAIEEDRDDRGAVSAVLRDQNRAAVATVVFTPTRGGTVVAVAARSTAGIHGFHVHANDNAANGVGCIADPAQPANTWFVSADGHFNPGGGTHGNHAGDMPPLFVSANGSASSSFVTDRFTTADVRGRAVILHAGNDNLGNVPVGTAVNQYTPNAPDATTLTANTGNAGNRIACGVIN